MSASRHPIRTRIAPSPTGDPHVGTAYTALFNYAFAKGRGGQFILRIEDTDQTRSTRASEAAILDALQWLGLRWDEGPDIGGPHGPYRQSERLAIYRAQVDRLLETGAAYRCFCTRERLAEMRAAQGADRAYDRRCRTLAPQEARRRAAAGEAHVIRMKVPSDGECVFEDLLRGEIRKDWASIDDQVILKSDGFPTYHLAVVVDDHLMGITHVIRGEEWLNSVPKHVQLYRYFAWPLPIFCHQPLLRNNDASKSKLSKRKNPTSVNYYRRAGYLPEALRNYLGLMGWLMPNGEEKFTLEEMCQNLALEKISLGGPVFDVAKLRWLNGRYIREDYSDAALLGLLEDWALNHEHLLQIVPLVHPRLETLADWGPLTAAFFADEVACDPQLIAIRGKSAAETLAVLQIVLWRLERQPEFEAAALDRLFREMAARLDLSLRQITQPFFPILSGRTSWTPLFHSMAVLGPDLVRMRLRRAIALLGGVSAKQRKQLEGQYVELFGPRD